MEVRGVREVRGGVDDALSDALRVVVTPPPPLAQIVKIFCIFKQCHHVVYHLMSNSGQNAMIQNRVEDLYSQML